MSKQDRNAQTSPQRDNPSHNASRTSSRNEAQSGNPGMLEAKHRPAGTQRQPQAAQTGSRENDVGDLEKQQELFK